ncbi:TPA: hypothetical protein ACH2JG_003922 [Enterobacter hormaechei]
MQKAVIGAATIYCGDSLEILREITGEFDAVITDPPYSSGGMTRSDRQAKPSGKYVGNNNYHEFFGDNRDVRSWAFWMTQWMSQAVMPWFSLTGGSFQRLLTFSRLAVLCGGG